MPYRYREHSLEAHPLAIAPLPEHSIDLREVSQDQRFLASYLVRDLSNLGIIDVNIFHDHIKFPDEDNLSRFHTIAQTHRKESTWSFLADTSRSKCSNYLSDMVEGAGI